MSYGVEQIKKQTEKEKVTENIGMYIGSSDSKGLHHLFYEILSNSMDEYLQGHCNKIIVTINKDNSLTIEDNGRGIPVGYKENGKSIIEEIFTIVHMGGKFDRQGYEYSGGKHGVGTTVVNYLSEFLDIEVKRDGFHYHLRFEEGKIIQKVEILGETKETGTKITFKPSLKYLSTNEWSYDKVNNILKKQHYLTNGLEYSLKQFDKITGELINEDNYLNNDGLSGYINSFVKNEEIKTFGNIIKIDNKIINYENKLLKKEEKLKISLAFQYSNQNSYQIAGYTNNLHQPEGGTHVNGMEELISNSIKNALISAKIKFPKDATKIDFLNGIVGIISINLSKPTLEGQTKNKLGDDFVKKIINDELKEETENLLLQDLEALNKIAKHVETNNRIRKAISNIENVTLKKVKDPGMDPDSKLTDAESKERDKCELFLVEGDSAGGSIDEMRNSQFEAVYKLKGKPLSAQTNTAEDIFGNKELKNLIIALGTGIGKNFDITKLRYGKVLILSDADVDGGHIQSLLLTFFKKYTPELLFQGKIFRVIPPLYGITTNKGEKIYLKDKKSLIEFEEKNQKLKYSVTRFKGLGEMNPSELYETCINSKNRIIEKITDENFEENKEFMELIMGPSNDFKYDFLKNYEREEVLELKKKSNKELKNVVEETMYDYGMYVNQDRSISNLEDGLKPVHKRALWAMLKLGIKSKGKKIKTSRIANETSGKYHPHGGVSVSAAISKLTQNFKLNNPLLEKQGNFGSIFGFNNIAADRYTEVQLSEFSEDLLLANLNENYPIVTFRDNYDGELKEPEYLPALLPMPLLIPTFGIGLGISSDIPPHNLLEVANATIAAIKNQNNFNANKYIFGPDFPLEQNEIIMEDDEIEKIYNEGNGSFRYRVKIDYNKEEHSLNITSLPYMVEFPTIYSELINLVKGEKFENSGKNKGKMKVLPYHKSLKQDIKKLENLSGKAGKKNGNIVHIRLLLNKGIEPEIVISKLYKLTKLETSVPFRPILINRKRKIKKYNLNEIILKFVDFRKETLTNLFNNKIVELKKDKISLETKIIVINNIKEILNILENSKDDKEAKDQLLIKYGIQDKEAEYVLDTKIRVLIKLNIEKIKNDIIEIENKLKHFNNLLLNEPMSNYMIDEIQGIKKKYGIKRKTAVIGKQKTINIQKTEFAFEDKDTIILINDKNLIYKVSGKQNKIDTKVLEFEEQYGVKFQLFENNRNKIYIVQDGKGYFINIGEIQEGNPKPIHLYNNKIDPNKEIEFIYGESQSEKDLFTIFEDGNINRIQLKNIIKSKQGFSISNKKIILSIINNETIEDDKNYCLIRLNDENLFSKHQLTEINKKQSIGNGMKLRGKTLKFGIFENNSIIKINEKEKINLNEIKDFSRTNKGLSGYKINSFEKEIEINNIEE